MGRAARALCADEAGGRVVLMRVKFEGPLGLVCDCCPFVWEPELHCDRSID